MDVGEDTRYSRFVAALPDECELEVRDLENKTEYIQKKVVELHTWYTETRNACRLSKPLRLFLAAVALSRLCKTTPPSNFSAPAWSFIGDERVVLRLFERRQEYLVSGAYQPEALLPDVYSVFFFSRSHTSIELVLIGQVSYKTGV